MGSFTDWLMGNSDNEAGGAATTLSSAVNAWLAEKQAQVAESKRVLQQAGPTILRGVQDVPIGAADVVTSTMKIPDYVYGLSTMGAPAPEDLKPRERSVPLKGAPAQVYHGTVDSTYDERFDKTQLREGGAERLQKVQDDFVRNNPGLSEEELQRRWGDYVKSDDYYERSTAEQLPISSAMSTAQGNVRSAVGREKSPANDTAADLAIQLAAGAAVGLPRSAGALVGKTLAGAVEKAPVLKKVMQAGEAITPITYPLTPANVAVNAVASEAIAGGTGAFRKTPELQVATVEPTETKGGVAATTPTVPPDPATEKITTKIAQDIPNKVLDDNYMASADPTLWGQAGMFGLLMGLHHTRAMRSVANPIIGGANEATKLAEASARTFDTPAAIAKAKAVDTALLRSTGSTNIDRKGPSDNLGLRLVDATRAAGHKIDATETLDRLRLARDTQKPDVDFDNAQREGVLPDGTKYNMPIRAVQQGLEKLPQKDRDLVEKYVHYDAIKARRTIQRQAETKELRALQAKVDQAYRDKKKPSKKDQDRIAELDTIWRNHRDDIKGDHRIYMDEVSNKEIDDLLDHVNSRPDLIKVIDETVGDYTAKNRAYRLKTGMMSQELADEWERASKYHLPLTEEGTSRPSKDFAARDATGAEGSFIPNQLPNTVEGLLHDMHANIFSIGDNNIKRRYIDTVRELQTYARTGKAGHIDNHAGGFEMVDMDHWKKENGGNRPINEAGVVRYMEDGKQREVVFKDPRVADAIAFHPDVITGIFSVGNWMRRIKQSGLTGPLATIFDSLFAPTAASYDLLAGSLGGKHRDIVFGGGSALSHALLDQSKLPGQVVSGLLKPVDLVTNIPAMAWQATAASAIKGSRYLAQAAKEDLISKSGFFHDVAVNGGEKWVEGLADLIIKKTENTTTMAVLRMHGGRSPFTTDPMRAQTVTKAWLNTPQASIKTVTGIQQRAGKMMDQANRRFGPGAPARAFKMSMRAYQGVLDNIARSASESAVAQTRAMYYFKHGKDMPPDVLRDTIAKAYRMGGDMETQPAQPRVADKTGVKHVAKFGEAPIGTLAFGATKLIPYANIAMQAMKHFAQQAMLNPAGTIASLTSLGATFAGMKMWYLSDPEAADYYYNVMPEWQKDSTFFMPSPEFLYAKATGQEMSHRDGFMMIKLTPEHLPIVKAIEAGIEYMAGDMHEEKSRVPLSTFPEQMGGWIKSSWIAPFIPWNAPIAGVAIAATGQRYDPFAYGSGEDRPSIATQFAEPGLGPDGTYWGGGTISNRMHEAAVALGGSAFDAFARMADSGSNAYQKMVNPKYNPNAGNVSTMEGLMEATKAVSKQFMYDSAKLKSDIPGLWNAKEKMTMSTPERQRIDTIKNAAMEIKKVADLSGQKADPKKPRYIAQQISDPTLKKVAYMVYDVMSKDQMKKILEGERKSKSNPEPAAGASDMRKDVRMSDRQRGFMTPQEQAKLREQGDEETWGIKDVQRQYRQANELLMHHEQQVNEAKLGKWWLKKYGVPYTVEDAIKRIRDDYTR